MRNNDTYIACQVQMHTGVLIYTVFGIVVCSLDETTRERFANL